MRKNKNTNIIGENVVLVPYRIQHVPKYHEWMKSDELQRLTASEPLSLQEEYEMQQSWLLDEDKCTFIILEKDKLNKTGDEVDAMIGDTNLFIQTSECPLHVAEAEIMIAEIGARGKHRGWEAMLLMLQYGCQELHIQKFVVKIALDNIKSIAMFVKMSFEEIGRSDVFHEITLEKLVTEEWKQWLQQATQGSNINLEMEDH